MSGLFFCSMLLVPVQETSPRLELPKNAYPMYGIAKVSQDGKSVALTVPGQGELRVQTLLMAVQVAKTVKDENGKERTVTVVEQKPTKRITFKPRTRNGQPDGKMVAQTYTVAVPRIETRTNKDGETYNVTVMVTEQRTRMVPLSAARMSGNGKPTLYKLAESTFCDLQGKPVKSDEVAKRLGKRSPILVVADPTQVDPYFRKALRQDMLLFVPQPMEPPKPQPAK